MKLSDQYDPGGQYLRRFAKVFDLPCAFTNGVGSASTRNAVKIALDSASTRNAVKIALDSASTRNAVKIALGSTGASTVLASAVGSASMRSAMKNALRVTGPKLAFSQFQIQGISSPIRLSGLSPTAVGGAYAQATAGARTAGARDILRALNVTKSYETLLHSFGRSSDAIAPQLFEARRSFADLVADPGSGIESADLNAAEPVIEALLSAVSWAAEPEMVEWAEVRRLHFAEGLSERAIGEQLGLARGTVRRALAAASPPKYARPLAGSAFDVYERSFADERRRNLTTDHTLDCEEPVKGGGEGGINSPLRRPRCQN